MSKRCLGYTKTGKKCRSRIKEKYFCECHKPYNYTGKQECCICCENIKDFKDLILFKCNHIFHKPCYYKWLHLSCNKPICPLCRKPTNKTNPSLKTKKKYEKDFLDIFGYFS